MAVLQGSTATELIFGAGAVGSFSVDDILAVDADYQQQTGYVGSPIAGAYVKNATDVLLDASYLRRVTFNVGRVATKTATSVLLAQPLIGGIPATNANAQKVIAFVDREGGSFFQEWSALFVVEEETGGRICFITRDCSQLPPAESKCSRFLPGWRDIRCMLFSSRYLSAT